MKTMRRSSGHARTEIRRRYAIAWVEYIDLSRPRPPQSHRCRRPSEFLLVTSNAHLTLSSIVETLPPRLRALYFNSDSPPSAFRSCDIRAGHYCPWYWRCRPCYARTSRIDPRGYIHIHACGLSMILCGVTRLRFRRNFFPLVVERYRRTP